MLCFYYYYSDSILTAFIVCRSLKYISLGQMNRLIKMSGTEFWVMSLLHTFYTGFGIFLVYAACLWNIHTVINFFTTFTKEVT